MSNVLVAGEFAGVQGLVSKLAANTASPDHVKILKVVINSATGAASRGGCNSSRLVHNLEIHCFVVVGRTSSQKLVRILGLCLLGADFATAAKLDGCGCCTNLILDSGRKMCQLFLLRKMSPFALFLSAIHIGWLISFCSILCPVTAYALTLLITAIQ